MARQRNPLQAVGPAGASSLLAPLSGATVTIRDFASQIATVYSGPTAAAALANPVTADTWGYLPGWLDPADYRAFVNHPSVALQAIEISLGNGPQGATGATGPVGAAGPASLTFRAAWVSGTAYSVGDVVSSGGAYYLCFLATSGTTAPSGDTSHWTLYTKQDLAGSAITFTPGVSGLYLVTGTLHIKYTTTNNAAYVQACIRENASAIEALAEVARIDNFGGNRQFQYHHWTKRYLRELTAGTPYTYDIQTSMSADWTITESQLLVEKK